MNDILMNLPAQPGDSALDLIDELPVAYVEIDAQGVITRANRAAVALHPPEHGELVGMVAWETIANDEKQISSDTFFASMECGENPPVVRRSFYTSKGEFRTFELHRNLIRDDNGRPTGIRVVSFDVTEAQNAHEKTRQARQLLESVLASFAEAVIVTDALGFVRYVNPAAEELLGWKARELTGKVIEKVLPQLSYTSADAQQKTLSHRIALERRTKGAATVLDRMRRELRVEISTSPIVDKNNSFTTGVVNILRKVEAAN